MKNEKLENLVNAINHISLNHEDLMDAVLDYSKIYTKNNSSDSAAIDLLFSDSRFTEQTLMAAREAIVLAMNAITLDENIPFKEIILHCVNIDNQRFQENELCADEDTKKLMQKFLCELRKELFSRVYSQNKDLSKVSKLSKGLLKTRYEEFMTNNF